MVKIEQAKEIRVISAVQAMEIARRFLNVHYFPFVFSYGYYVFENGEITLQVMKEVNVTGFAYCRVLVFGLAVGYFNFDLRTGEMSPLWKED